MLITHYIDPGQLVDDELELLDSFYEANLERGWVPYYRFRMVHANNRAVMGNITLRLGNQPSIVLYAGHVGYGVDDLYRGNHYAARGVRLILPHARKHGINPLWITCNPDNIPSRRSCEIAGGRLIEIVDLPPDNPMYKIGERQKCRYRFEA